VAAADTDRGSRGLPVGVQVVAVPGVGEEVVLAALAAIEGATAHG
jgi:Asp-tRNA(Asn)/Glu-tRNA(Gln) amidotransferase A subunit family amidase